MTLENCLDLKQIHRNQDPEFLIQQDVKIGVARRFISEINNWAQPYQPNQADDFE
jgi:hypothetical protein